MDIELTRGDFKLAASKFKFGPGSPCAGLEAWIADAKASPVASFVSGIVQGRAAEKAALTELWSNGQTEGQNTKLKWAKRQMYSRAKLDLLRAR